uniref:Winged helix-turn-helix transcriptional regulator n=1 Tax=Geoglobus ahangari TaxID=113653 RepID=A0A7C3YNT3_9EURY
MGLRKLKHEVEMTLRHFRVLKAVKDNQPIGIFRLSEILNMPKHRVRYSLRVLEHSGVIEPSQHGAIIPEGAEERIKKMKEDLKEIKKYLEEIEKIANSL